MSELDARTPTPCRSRGLLWVGGQQEALPVPVGPGPPDVSGKVEIKLGTCSRRLVLCCADYLIPGALTSPGRGPLGAETHISEAGTHSGKQTAVPKETGLSSRAEMRPLPSSSLCQGTWSLCPQSIWGFSPESRIF